MSKLSNNLSNYNYILSLIFWAFQNEQSLVLIPKKDNKGQQIPSSDHNPMVLVKKCKLVLVEYHGRYYWDHQIYSNHMSFYGDQHQQPQNRRCYYCCCCWLHFSSSSSQTSQIFIQSSQPPRFLGSFSFGKQRKGKRKTLLSDIQIDLENK